MHVFFLNMQPGLCNEILFSSSCLIETHEFYLFFCGYVTWRITLGKGNWFVMYRTNFSDVPHSSGITTFYTCKMRSFFASCLRFNHPTGSTISRLFKPSPKKRDILLLHLDTKYEWLEIWLGYFAITCGYTKCMKYESWLNMFYSYFSGYTSSIWIWDRLNDYTKYHYWSKILRPFAGRRIDELDPRWFRSLFGGGGAKLAQLQKYPLVMST